MGAIDGWNEAIVRLRKRAGLKQGEAAQRAKLSAAQLSRYESGASSPSLKTLSRILEVYGVDLATLGWEAKQLSSSCAGKCGSEGKFDTTYLVFCDQAIQAGEPVGQVQGLSPANYFYRKEHLQPNRHVKVTFPGERAQGDGYLAGFCPNSSAPHRLPHGQAATVNDFISRCKSALHGAPWTSYILVVDACTAGTGNEAPVPWPEWPPKDEEESTGIEE